MFLAALFVIVQIWKQSEGPSIGEAINKPWYNYIMVNYSEIRKNELPTHATA